MSLSKRLISTEGQVVVTDAFNIVTYTGDGTSSRSFTGLGFQPDMVWIKARNNPYSHHLQDSSRGGGSSAALNPNLTLAEGTYGIYGYVNSFDTDGFTVGTGSTNNVHVNASGTTYVAWCWRAGGNSNTYNVDGVGYSTRSAAGLDNGTIADAKFLGASVNTQAGFSIQHINGSGASAGQTIDTGLTQQAELLIIKRLDSTGNWVIPQDATDQYLFLNTTAAGTSITFTDYVSGTNNILYDFYEYVCYSFHSVEGFSKIGSYTGNGSTNGPTITTGFEPAYVMSKNLDSAESWYIWDNKRSTTNPRHHLLLADTDNSEFVNSTNYALDFLSNGFQLKNTVVSNASGKTYLYIAFAEAP